MCFTREVGLFYAQEMCKTGSLARCYVTQSILQWIIVLYIMDHIYYFLRRIQILDISTIHFYINKCVITIKVIRGQVNMKAITINQTRDTKSSCIEK